MTDSIFMRVDEVMELLDISRATAYKIMREMNSELKAMGYVTVSGRVSRKYFNEKFYSNNIIKEGA